MNISWEWLSSLCDLTDLSPKQIYDEFTLHSAGVEGYEEEGKFLSQVYTVKILSKRPHPNADKLNLVTITDGNNQNEVVCGAPNVEVGKVAIYASIGTELPGGFKLTPKKIRGVLSEGMLCSERELEMSDSHDGIIILPEDTELNIPYSKILKKEDTIFDIDNKSLTHRPDLWGHLGIARELSALFNKKFTNFYDYDLLNIPSGDEPLEIENNIPDKCLRYAGVIISNLKVKPSPEWMQRRLSAIGSRPINNIVDATNYIMFELGQPMHAFDKETIKGNKIIIRDAQKDERLTTLDEKEHILTGDEIIIADSERSLALGGVMGALNSEVSNSTTKIILESANFLPKSIRVTANRLNMRTDAAQRFEKSQDPENVVIAILRFMELIKQTCPDACFSSKISDSYPVKKKPIQIETSLKYIRNSLGCEIEDDRIISILTSLGFGITKNEGSISVKVPSFRATKDISIAIDLVEEVGRIYGYDNITPAAPNVSMLPPHNDGYLDFIRNIKELLSIGFNFTEIYNYSFLDPEDAKKCDISIERALKLKNPISSESNILCTSLLPNFLKSISKNTRFSDTLKFYEISRTFDDKSEDEELIVGIYTKENNEHSLIELKHSLSELFKRLGFKAAFQHHRAGERFHPYRNGKLIVGRLNTDFGELHPKIINSFGIKGRVSVCSFSLKTLFEQKLKSNRFNEISKYPSVPFDISIVMSENDYIEKVIKKIRSASSDLINEIQFLGFYKNASIGRDKKSATFHVEFQAKDRTISSEERSELEGKVINTLEKAGFPLKQ